MTEWLDAALGKTAEEKDKKEQPESHMVNQECQTDARGTTMAPALRNRVASASISARNLQGGLSNSTISAKQPYEPLSTTKSYLRLASDRNLRMAKATTFTHESETLKDATMILRRSVANPRVNELKFKQHNRPNVNNSIEPLDTGATNSESSLLNISSFLRERK